MENNEIKHKKENDKNETNNYIDMSTLISKLKAEDSTNLQLSKMFKWVYIALIVIYAIILLVNYEKDLLNLFSDLSFIISFILFAIIFVYNEKEYKKIDYSLPLVQMLKKGADRYKLTLPRNLVVFLPVLIMDIGLTLNFYDEPFGGTSFNRVLIVQAIYLPVMFLSGYIGFKVWKKKQKPLRDEALKMLKELGE